MAFQILLNLLIALVWMYLHDAAWNTATFFVGYVIGIVFIFMLRRFFPNPFYLRRLFAIFNLILLFVKELIVSGIHVLREVIKPTITIQPGIFRVETEMKSEWEITLLCNLITLTPGSVIVEVAPEEQVLFIHALDIPNNEQLLRQAKVRFEQAIMEVTR